MKNFIFIIVLIIYNSSCVSVKATNNKLLNKPDVISYSNWKKSVRSIAKLKSFDLINFDEIVKKISEEDFNRLNNGSLNRNKKDFYLFSYTEGEIVSITLNFYKYNNINYERSSLVLEHGKITHNNIQTKINVNFNDFISNEDDLKASGFLTLTKFESNKLVSKIYDITFKTDKYLGYVVKGNDTD